MQLLPHVEWSGSDAYVHLIYVEIAEICRYRSEIGLVNSFDATVSTLASINLKFIVPAIGVVKVDSFLNWHMRLCISHKEIKSKYLECTWKMLE